MNEPLKLGRKVLSVVLAITLLLSSFPFANNIVNAAPSPSGQSPKGAGTLEGLIRSRAGSAPGYHVDDNLSSNLTRPLPAIPPGSTGETTFGVRGLAVWEAPNRFLLRWVPDDDWIPDEGYSLFRMINGQPRGLIDGLGTNHTSTAQVDLVNRALSSASSQPLGQFQSASNTSAATAQAPLPVSPRFGDELFTPQELNTAITDLRNASQVNEEVRQSLKQRNLLGQDLTNTAVEKALKNLNASAEVADQTKVISGQGAFVARFNSTMQQTVSPQFVLPNKATAPAITPLPIVTNKSELAQLREMQLPKTPLAVPRAPTLTSAQAQPAVDPVTKLTSARKSLLTLANVNFPAAVAAGLGYIDTVAGVSQGQSVQYGLIPTATLRSLLNGTQQLDRQFLGKPQIKELLGKPQISVEFGKALTVDAPFNLQGYALDHKAYLRWDDAVNSTTRNILSGYVVERRLPGENDFQVLNPDEPVVKMYAKDDEGNLLEPDVLYTDETVADNITAIYQIRAVDVFGRTSAPCPAVDLTVFKTVPPPTPAIGIGVMAKDTDLSKPVLGPVAPMSVGEEDWKLALQTSLQYRQITRSQYDKLAAYKSVDEDQLRQFVSDGLISKAQFDDMMRISGKAEELAHHSQLEQRIASIRQSLAQKSGTVVLFNHSLEGDATSARLAEDLRDYRIYRSEALGKGDFSEPAVVSTIAVNQLTLPYGTAQNPLSDLIYYDTDVTPGHYYAYWITARDGSGNESPAQSKPQIVGYPSEAVPGSPENPQNQFTVNEELTAPQPKIAGFSERLQIKKPAALAPLTVGGKNLNAAAAMKAVTTKDLHRLVIVGADEVNADGSVTVSWLPATAVDLVGYVIYRAQDPSGSALTTSLTEADLERLQWSLVNVNNDPDKRGIEEEQILTTNQLRDTVSLPARGCYLYEVYLITSDTYAPPSKRGEDESPYVEGGRVTIQWTASTDPQVAGYRVYRSEVPREAVAGTSAGFTPRWDMIAQLVPGNMYVDQVDQSKVHYYQYKVATVSIWGVESSATTIAIPVRINTTIPPAVPAFLTPIAQPGQVQLRWKPVYDATQYTIYRGSKVVPEVTTDDLAKVLQELGITTQLQAKDEQALLKLVEEKIGQLTEAQQLALYQKIKQKHGMLALAPYYALDQESAAEIKWEAVQTFDLTYEQNEANVLNNTVMTWTDTQVDYPQIYLYAIEAQNEDRLVSGLSSPVSVGPQKSVGPNAPEAVALEVKGDQVKLTWMPYTSKKPMGYLVYKAPEENGQYQQCSPLLASSEFTEQLQPGQEWWYRVVIIDEVGLASAASKSVKASVSTPTLPDLNLNLKPGLRPGSILPPAILQDRVPLAVVGPILPAGPTLPPIGPGTIRPLPGKPAAPVVTTGEVTGNSVSLAWGAAANVTQYKVYGYRTEEPETLMATAKGAANSCTVTGLTPSTRYYFYVVAVNDFGDSAPSKVVNATTKAATAASQPQWGTLNLQVTATSQDSISLSWTDSGAAPDGYKIYYYKTEEPEKLLQTVTGSTRSFTAAGLQTNTTYFFYIVATKGGRSSAPSNVAKGLTKVQAPPVGTTALPTTLKVAGYTVTNIKSLALAPISKVGQQVVGQLVIAGLNPIPVNLDVQEFRGDTLTKGSVSLSGTYRQGLEGSSLVLTALSLSAAGPAKVTGQLLISGTSPMAFTDTPLSPEGVLTVGTIDQLWVGEDRLNALQGVTVQLSGSQRGLRVSSGQLESTLGQVTVTGQGLLFAGSNFALDFNGRLTGEFQSNFGGFDLVVPRLWALQIDTAILKINQGVVDSQSSRLSGRVVLPFLDGQTTATVTTPTDTSGANQVKPGGEQERVNPGDIAVIGQRFNYGTLAAAGNVLNLGDSGKLALKGSISYLLGAAKAKASTSADSQAQNQNMAMRSMSMTTTFRSFSEVPFAIDQWDGQGILPTVNQTQPLKGCSVHEIASKAVIVNGGGMDTTYLLGLAADQLKLSLPAFHIQDSAEDVRQGGPGARGFEILQGSVYLPPNGVALRGEDGESQTFALAIPGSTIFYGRNGLIGHMDTEATAGQSIDIWLNQDVAATMSGAAIDVDANQVKWSIAGTMAVPQLGANNGRDRVLSYGAFSDPQGGLIFRIEPEIAPITSSSGRSVQILGGTLKGSDLYLDGRLNVDTPTIAVSNLDFVALRLYMGSGQPTAEVTDYNLGLAAKPVEARVKDFTMHATGVKVEQNRDNVWQFNVTGAMALTDNLPLNKGTVVNLDTNPNAAAAGGTQAKPFKFKTKLNYTYEQFLTIDVNVQYENGEFRGEGEFWFITGDEGDDQRSQATGTVQARVGKTTDGVSYWLFKLGYGQSTKTWKCDKCGFEFEGNHPPTKCPGTKNGSPCTGTKDDYKTDWQCSLCKSTPVHAKEPPKSCEGKKDGKDCTGGKDDFKQVSKPKTKEDAEGAGLMIGPVQINNIMAMMGYNVELPKAADGTFDVPVGFDNDQKLYEWKTLSNGKAFFVAKAYMTVWHDGERFLTLEPVRLVIASGPAVEMEANIKRDGKLLAYGKIGYYHEDRRFFLSVKIPKLELPGIEARLEDLNLLLDFSPKKQVVNLSYPEMVKLYIPGSPWDFAGGFAYENNDGSYLIKMKARAQYGFDGSLTILYLKAKVGLTVDANLGFPKDQSGQTQFEFQLMILLEGDLRAGVKVGDYQHEILHAYLGLAGYLGKTVRQEWWVYGKAKIYYHIDLWLWEDEGEEEWTIGSVPQGVELLKPTESKDEKPKAA